MLFQVDNTELLKVSRGGWGVNRGKERMGKGGEGKVSKAREGGGRRVGKGEEGEREGGGGVSKRASQWRR